MKQKKFIKHLKAHDCTLAREGANHSIYQNNQTGARSTVPRHPDIKENLCKKICKDLGIPYVK